MRTLEKLTIKGFKSIREQTLELDSLNVFIGGNGVGKSNLIGAFQFLQEVINRRLGKYAATRGGADSILHFGRKTTKRLEFLLEFDQGDDTITYHLEIEGTEDSGLVISKEAVSWKSGLPMVDGGPSSETISYHKKTPPERARTRKHSTARSPN